MPGLILFGETSRDIFVLCFVYFGVVMGTFIARVWSVIGSRPARVWASVRCRWLFLTRRFLLTLFPGIYGKRVQLGMNVRVQRLSTFLADREASVLVGSHSIVYENARIEAHGRGVISIGECSVLGDCRIYSRSRVTLGKRLLVSWNVLIQDFDPHPQDPIARGKQVETICHQFVPRFDSVESKFNERFVFDFPSQDIVLGDDVWLGANSTILKGAKIGDGCIVAAGAVVSKGDYPAGSVLAGNPARIVKTLRNVVDGDSL
jgi:acetyltransferase-like isoleucine patch superfamily enzyme